MDLCTSRLRVEAEPTDLVTVLEAINGVNTKGEPSPIDFNRIAPLPNEHGYIDAWGTSGGPYDVSTKGSADDGRIQWEFTSEFAPPDNALRTLSDRFKAATFDLLYANPHSNYGPSKGYAGRLVLRGGTEAEAIEAWGDEATEFVNQHWPEKSAWWRENH